ncbi:MAG: apolipoprotein N-acyltransferase [Treponema sp.]|nr:apolipoprotein N-acyltransferase [Treponema sp.]
MILQVFYSVFSGACLAAAIPNEIYSFGAPFFTLIAFIPFYLCFYRIKSYKEAFWLSFTQAITTHLISSFWLAYFKDFAIFTLGASALGTGFIGGFMGFLYYLPFASSKAHNKLNQSSALSGFFLRPYFRIIYFAALYTIYEWVKSSGFLGYPWGTVSSAMFRWPVIMQLSAITGTYGITFFIVMINAFLAEALVYCYDTSRTDKDKSHRAFDLQITSSFSLICLAAILLYGLVELSIPRKPIKSLSTVLVQQNADPWKMTNDNQAILTSERLTEEKLKELKEEKKKADLIVWSEGVLTKAFPYGRSHYKKFPHEKPLISFIEENKVPLLSGGSYVKNADKRQINNAALIFDKEGNFRGYYAKNHLVPFAEVIPFSEIPAVSNFLKKVVGISAGWTPGDQYVYFDIPCSRTENYRLPAVKNIDISQDYAEQEKEERQREKVRICTPICFDDAFTDIMRPLFLNGAELFMNITDDSWSLKNSSEIQHFVIASYRAIEYRTTLVRCANAGYSVVVDPAGRIIEEMPLFTEKALAADIPVYKRTMTCYARLGNWFPYCLIISFLIYMTYSIFTFCQSDYIPSARKIKSKSKKHKKKNSKNKK